MIPIRDTIRLNRFPIMNWVIIFLNALVFLYELSLKTTALNKFISLYALVPAALHLNRPLLFLEHPFTLLTLVTSMFMHAGWLHIISNMWVLLIFGDNIEDRLGSFRYLMFYLLCGIAANILQALVYPHSTIPSLGASGAIAGILGAYFVFFPASRVLTLVPIFIIPWLIEIPAIFYLGFWFISQLYSGLFSLRGANMGGIAWWAHVGGFLFGFLFARLFVPSQNQEHLQRIDDYYRF